ncbi:aminotransferase class IV [Brevibacterium sp. RIT 803]|uniref:aminotransferase class IV n=1 Tax=Brevibacterium sp. RIT 803 TaxID=2810210 RepID=UPI0019524880|nr:aminotransferase class IV [Brevibacterium sp. RIT 803]MBM6588468.1 aminotransferase class IV [Brevibacterium sp. RIT 803]
MTTWTWDGSGKVFDAGEPEGALLAADSWFVSDGKVRAFDRHRRRFNSTARELGFSEPSSEDFWAALIDLIPPSGEWFPRVEIIGDDNPVLGFRLRPSPTRTDELRVWAPPFSDPRQNPHVKGPDIGLLEDLRGRARVDHNCDEVLLVDERGFAVESATSSLLWWEDLTLCVPHPDLAQLPGVTSSLIQAEALRRSIGIDFRLCTPTDLSRHEVWLVNALHGIRRVCAWSGMPHPSPAPERFWEWKTWLEHQMESI